MIVGLLSYASYDSLKCAATHSCRFWGINGHSRPEGKPINISSYSYLSPVLPPSNPSSSLQLLSTLPLFDFLATLVRYQSPASCSSAEPTSAGLQTFHHFQVSVSRAWTSSSLIPAYNLTTDSRFPLVSWALKEIMSDKPPWRVPTSSGLGGDPPGSTSKPNAEPQPTLDDDIFMDR